MLLQNNTSFNSKCVFIDIATDLTRDPKEKKDFP